MYKEARVLWKEPSWGKPAFVWTRTRLPPHNGTERGDLKGCSAALAVRAIGDSVLRTHADDIWPESARIQYLRSGSARKYRRWIFGSSVGNWAATLSELRFPISPSRQASLEPAYMGTFLDFRVEPDLPTSFHSLAKWESGCFWGWNASQLLGNCYGDLVVHESWRITVGTHKDPEMHTKYRR